MLEVYCSVYRVRSQLWAFRAAYMGNKSKVIKSGDNMPTAEGIEESGANGISLDGSEGDYLCIAYYIGCNIITPMMMMIIMMIIIMVMIKIILFPCGTVLSYPV